MAHLSARYQHNIGIALNQLTKRRQTHSRISSALACMSNKQLQQMLAEGKAMHKGIGGTSLQIEVDNTPIFVKKVPITDLELQPENYMSTANIFNLPMCYQYGIGSTGFGAWRELAAHVMTTNWVITGQCHSFPIMYHWRILQNTGSKIISDEEQIALDKVALKMDEFYKAIQKDKSTPFPSGNLKELLPQNTRGNHD